jgi:hypothetical protein
MGMGFKIPWIGCSIYHGYMIENIMGMWVKIPWVWGSIDHG